MMRHLRPVPTVELMRIALRIYTALDLMLTGRGGVEEWRDVCDAINAVESLEELGRSHDMPLEVVQNAMAATAAVWQTTGSMALEPQAAEPLRLICQTYINALEKFSERTMREAESLTLARINRHRDQAIHILEAA